MKMCVRIAIIATVILLFPHLSFAQTGFAGRIRSLQEVLEQLYDDMMPLCSRLIQCRPWYCRFCRDMVYRFENLGPYRETPNRRFFIPSWSLRNWVC